MPSDWRGPLSKKILTTYYWGGFAGLIAEIKRRSPSRGDINPGLDPARLAGEYLRSSVTVCISVLTESERFGGSADDLRAVRRAVGPDIAILRKDFLRTDDDITDSKEMGASAVLLIAAELGDRLADMHAHAVECGLEPLVEVRCETDIDEALEAGARMIAVNQRGAPESSEPTLDFGKAARLAPYLPADTIKVAASGIGVAGGTNMAEIEGAGYHAALVGEALVAAADPYETARRLALV